MPTIVSHAAVPLALAVGFGRGVVPGRLLLAGVAASIAPDLDVLAFSLGVAYDSPLGHRGFTHAVPFAVLAAVVGAGASRALRAPRLGAFLFLLVAMASHGLLDTCTNGGLGVALLWPWSSERFFAAFRPIEVSPLSVHPFFSQRGVDVLASELVWVWLPCALLAALALAARKARALDRSPG